MINCENIPLKDKGCHFIAGFVIGLVVAFVVNPLIGIAASLLAGLAKEAYDQYKYKGGDFFDFFATLAGGFAGTFLYGIIQNV